MTSHTRHGISTLWQLLTARSSKQEKHHEVYQPRYEISKPSYEIHDPSYEVLKPSYEVPKANYLSHQRIYAHHGAYDEDYAPHRVESYRYVHWFPY